MPQPLVLSVGARHSRARHRSLGGGGFSPHVNAATHRALAHERGLACRFEVVVAAAIKDQRLTAKDIKRRNLSQKDRVVTRNVRRNDVAYHLH